MVPVFVGPGRGQLLLPQLPRQQPAQPGEELGAVQPAHTQAGRQVISACIWVCTLQVPSLTGMLLVWQELALAGLPTYLCGWSLLMSPLNPLSFHALQQQGASSTHTHSHRQSVSRAQGSRAFAACLPFLVVVPDDEGGGVHVKQRRVGVEVVEEVGGEEQVVLHHDHARGLGHTHTGHDE